MMIDGPVYSPELPGDQAGTDTRPGSSQAEDAGTPARRWRAWDEWLATYEQTCGGGWSSSGSVRPAK